MSSFAACLLVLGVICCVNAKLPDFFKACKLSDPSFSECASKEAQNAIAGFKNGYKPLKMPSIMPYLVKKVTLEPSDSLKIDITDLEAFGFQDITFTSIKIDGKHWSIAGGTPLATVNAHYDMNGKILILPIQGNGPCSFEFKDFTFVYEFDVALVDKGGKQYAKMISPKFSFDTGHISYHLGNLFNGDKIIGDEMNIFLNDNWKEVGAEISPALSATTNILLTQMVSNVFEFIPYDEIVL